MQASVHLCEALLLPADTFNPVLSGTPRRPLQLELVTVGTGRPPAGAERDPLGCLPASWRGTVPGAAISSGRVEPGGVTIRWQLDLTADGGFQLREASAAPEGRGSRDASGRWLLEQPGNRLRLERWREAPLLLEPLEGAPGSAGSTCRADRSRRRAPTDCSAWRGRSRLIRGCSWWVLAEGWPNRPTCCSAPPVRGCRWPRKEIRGAW